MKTDSVNRRIFLEKELQRILHILIKDYSPQRVILFGSLSSNITHETSDIDLLIIKDSQKRHLERVDEVMRLIHPRAGVDLFVFTPKEIRQALDEENSYLEDILARGKVLYEKAG